MLVPPFLLTLWLTDSRDKLRYLTVATATGVALVALKGGYWAVMTGFADRVYGPTGSQIGGNNEFSVALAMTIPLLVLWLRQTAVRPLRWIIGGTIALCYVAALTSWSRGGLLTLAAMSSLLIWHSKHKPLAVLLLAAGMAVALVTCPTNGSRAWKASPATRRINHFRAAKRPGNRDWHTWSAIHGPAPASRAGDHHVSPGAGATPPRWIGIALMSKRSSNTGFRVSCCGRRCWRGQYLGYPE